MHHMWLAIANHLAVVSWCIARSPGTTMVGRLFVRWAVITGGRLQPVLMRHTPQLSVKTRGGGGLGGLYGPPPPPPFPLPPPPLFPHAPRLVCEKNS